MSRRRIAAIIDGRDPEIFAKNVRRARESLGWTRQKLCQEAGVSPQTLTKVEGGQGCTPGVEHKIATSLGTVVGRLWERQELPRQLVRTPAADRWYFAGPEDGERFWKRHNLPEAEQRFDPDAIQHDEERARMGGSGLVRGFVRVTTGHLQAGSIISSVLEVYGQIESGLPDGKLAYFFTIRGDIRFHIGDQIHELTPGAVLQAEMVEGSWLEPAKPVEPGELPPLLIYVDVNARLNPKG